MIRNVVEHIGGIETYGIVSICLFFATFVGMLIWAFRLKRPFLESMSALPLDETTPEGPDEKEPKDE